jgi:hypothetical protein
MSTRLPVRTLAAPAIAAYTRRMLASTGVTAAIITVAAGALVGASVAKPSQPVPIRIRVRRGLRAIRRR